MASADKIVAREGPFEVTLEAGKDYYYCTCGRSKKQPFCDGSHKALSSGIKPKKITVEETRTAYLCGCKQTKSEPFCDGSHASLKKEGAAKKKDACGASCVKGTLGLLAIGAIAFIVMKHIKNWREKGESRVGGKAARMRMQVQMCERDRWAGMEGGADAMREMSKVGNKRRKE
eukprot:CAMPEP_0113883424 /NCGR_PEP_ID=MMETSP0780_2-20120614/9590_1 /TAXON_ID=652834 /ORGANISM="Palpitomonas bilix" /LENGTH=173 /DNA_ID=CAMNT_0000870723 /DNA_START=24 /DNA_END=546 /DNA_ORIENTATION=- /assembly_acc=CAM_ASM_000599